LKEFSGEGLSIYDVNAYYNPEQSQNIALMSATSYLKRLISKSVLNKVMKDNILRLIDWKFKE